MTLIAKKRIIPLAPATPPPVRVRSNASRVVAAVVLLATFALCMGMYTRHNAFPIEYHPDERGKAAQVLSPTGERNFNHPQLLLEATQWATRWLAADDHPQAVVQVGRTVSATLAALGVVALALCGYMATGLPGLIAVTPIVALCPFLLAHSHFMKEDAALAFGVALAVLGSRLLWDWGGRPVLGWLAVIVLASGCATATSAKYVGVVTFALAALVLPLAPPRRLMVGMLRPVVLLSYAVTLIVLINHRVFADPDEALEGFDREYAHGTTDHAGLTMNQPNAFVWDSALHETFPHARIMLVAGLLLALLWWRGGRPRGGLGWDRCLWAFLAIVLWVLSKNVIPMYRYALPVVVLAATLAGLAAARVGQFVGRSWAVWGVPIAFAGITIAWQGARCADYVEQFRDDSRQRLREFLLTEGMRNAFVVADQYAGLRARPYDGMDDGLNRRVRTTTLSSAADMGSLDRLRRMGVTHVAVADLTYDRYFDGHVHPTPDFTYGYARYREFYERLFREGTLVWSRQPTHPTRSYVNPSIRVYMIAR